MGSNLFMWTLSVVLLLAWSTNGNAAATCNSGDSAALMSFKAGFSEKGEVFGTWVWGTDCCSWAGVTCTDGGRVKAVALVGPEPSVGVLDYTTVYQPGVKRKPSYPVVGTSLSKLTALEVINFQNVFFNSKVPDSWAELTSLRTLQLDTCNITGTIPTSINKLKNLETLHITPGWYSEAGLTGSLPPQVCDLNKLIFLGLEGNSLRGSLPSCFNRLTALKYLQLEENEFTGTIPWGIGSMTALSEVNLADNQISGYIPGSIGSLANLTYLNLEYNQLSGPIPEAISNLVSLVECKLSNNQLSGRIPLGIGKLTKLQVLEMRDNEFFGEIPASLGKLASLAVLELDNNKFWGSIPSELASIKGGRITLSHNHLSGSIPAVLLQNEDSNAALHLDVSHNFLSGTVPTTVGNVWALLASDNSLSGGFPLALSSVNTVDLRNNKLDQSKRHGKIKNGTYYNPLYPEASKIRELYLSNNKFSGPFPEWLLDLKSLRFLDISQNKFSGALPDALFDFKTLWALNVSNNAFSSKLPLTPYKYVDNHDVIQMLDLHGNKFFGPIPYSFLGALSKHGIIGLDLSHNDFSGTVDPEIGSIGGANSDPWTHHLDLSDNKLTGPIPRTIGNLKNLKYLDLSKNDFTGAVPASISLLKELIYLNLSKNAKLGGVTGNQQGKTENKY